MDISHFLIYCIAVWRISSLLVSEDGPGYMFRHIREFAGIVHDGDGTVFQIPDNFFAQVLSCVWCSSIWVSLFFAALWMIAPEIALRLSVIFAFSGGAIMIEKFISLRSA